MISLFIFFICGLIWNIICFISISDYDIITANNVTKVELLQKRNSYFNYIIYFALFITLTSALIFEI